MSLTLADVAATLNGDALAASELRWSLAQLSERLRPSLDELEAGLSRVLLQDYASHAVTPACELELQFCDGSTGGTAELPSNE